MFKNDAPFIPMKAAHWAQSSSFQGVCDAQKNCVIFCNGCVRGKVFLGQCAVMLILQYRVWPLLFLTHLPTFLVFLFFRGSCITQLAFTQLYAP